MTGDASVGEFATALADGLDAPAGSSAFARPKSNTFTVPSGRTLMFCGFRSRWIMSWMSPRRCFGSFWRQRFRNTVIVGERSPGRRLHWGSLLTTETIVSVMSSPGNARVPVSIS